MRQPDEIDHPRPTDPALAGLPRGEHRKKANAPNYICGAFADKPRG
jgi:hypothetical protein